MSSFEFVPNEILIIIISSITAIDILSFSMTSVVMMNIIKLLKVDHVIDCIKNPDTIKHMIETYSFVNFDMSRYRIVTGDHMNLFSNCLSINLSSCNMIRDEHIKYLQNCKNVNLSSCKFITDAGVKYLAKCHYVNLSHCNITDQSLSYLSDFTLLY